MLSPFRSVNDRKFSWLHRNVFLPPFRDWLNFIQQHQEKVTKDAGQKMFILR